MGVRTEVGAHRSDQMRYPSADCFIGDDDASLSEKILERL